MTILEEKVANAVYHAAYAYIEQRNTIDWEQRRYEIAKDCLAGMASGKDGFCYYSRAANYAVKYADDLIKALKNDGEETESNGETNV